MTPASRHQLERLMYALSEYRQFGARRANTLDAEDKRLLLSYLKAAGEIEDKAGAA